MLGYTISDNSWQPSDFVKSIIEFVFEKRILNTDHSQPLFCLGDILFIFFKSGETKLRRFFPDIIHFPLDA